jgi:hypothetical protein
VRSIAAWAVIGLCAVWLTYYFTTSPRPGRPDPEFDTPAWHIANELNGRLAAQPGFENVAFSVTTESPLRFNLHGMVGEAADLERLQTLAKQIRPENDYDVEVRVGGSGG